MDKGTLDAIGLHPDGPVKRYLLLRLLSFIVNYRTFFLLPSTQLGLVTNNNPICLFQSHVLGFSVQAGCSWWNIGKSISTPE